MKIFNFPIALAVIWNLGCGGGTPINDEKEMSQATEQVPIGNPGRGAGALAGKAAKMAASGVEKSALADVLTGKDQKVQFRNASQTLVKARMIIKSADLAFEVEKYDDANMQIQKITEQFGGFIAASNTEIPFENVKRGTVTLRIPSEKFEAALVELKKLAKKLESEGLRGDDVTEEFYDVEARLNNAKKTEMQYLDILRTAHTVTDVLAVQRELNEIRDHIDRFEGRRKFLMDQTGLSTIRVSFHDPYPVRISSSGGFWSTIGEGFERGYKGFAVTLGGVITFLIAGLPVFALIILTLFGLVKWYKRWQSKKQPPAQTK